MKIKLFQEAKEYDFLEQQVLEFYWAKIREGEDINIAFKERERSLSIINWLKCDTTLRAIGETLPNMLKKYGCSQIQNR
ncbi:MAG: hypothetical protein F6K24_03560 [Okeania sp. SIO2D1]|nr:hypothetical protein [Okeania sp. SIO2D1]